MRTNGSIINLTVHGIGPAERPLDPGEDHWWVSVEQFEQVLDAVVGRRDVRITFDDGNASDVRIALPRLLERGLRAEFFVLAGLLGEPGRLDEADVRELARAGMRVGSHGWAHRDWRHIDHHQAVEEFDAAHRVISRLCGHPVTRVAIPFGSYDRNVLRRLRGAGVTCAYTSNGSWAWPSQWLQDRYTLFHGLDEHWTCRVLDRSASLAVRARKTAGRLYKRWRGSPLSPAEAAG
ncbi:polysaccharide deacetylase family protein [Nonomuraea sp. NN258]|uniref:polysaccharide deacetylase family protein n=1 Tax=Nonomuraea antri TaxID=2730852 RepID=UPI0015698ED6|nr:polysaccharide deacetylase family protein [Nonomuraea antri]NRQ32509.1 polysaccharide deacetylase family protein [Nonomuraea antri]